MTATKAKKQGGGFFSLLQRVGRAFMLPIALLPIAGLLLGIGASFTNVATLETYNLMGFMGPGTVLYSVFTLLSSVGTVIFDNLPLLFAMGVALGMAENEKATATLSAAIAFFVMHKTINALLLISGRLDPGVMQEGTVANVVGIESLQMGVFGGIIVGLGVAWLNNRFYKIRLPNVISFFGGTRFVPIISTTVYLLVGVLMFFAWPFVQSGIYALGDLVLRSGYAGTFIYGFIERILIPFGLHHVFYLPFWQTGVGGSALIDGVMVYGAQNIFFAELASPSVSRFSVSATRFMSGKFPLMIFGLPGAALAMYTCADSKKKKVAGGLLLSAALTSMLTGITEPIEFTFLFVAPILYVIHSVFAGLAYMLMHLLDVGVGMTFSGGLIDLTLFGILQGNAKTNWVMIPLVGVFYFAVYFFLFRFLIRWRNYATPGRESDGEEVKLYTRADYNQKKEGGGEEAASQAHVGDGHETSRMILEGLGGKENIVTLDCCATRLRVSVKDESLVSDSILRQSGASGVIRRGGGVQVVYGPQVSVIKSELEEYMRTI
ncbi:MAG: PTS transporter subunit EIIC [Clostridia bacterium]|nr:PTS transporter subunit EIIC [Clostridia bacterium]MBQ9774273.1 PTS transporter subunit EIIC [Clostridia bacterium]